MYCSKTEGSCRFEYYVRGLFQALSLYLGSHTQSGKKARGFGREATVARQAVTAVAESWKLVIFKVNRPFARSGHMVQNHTC